MSIYDGLGKNWIDGAGFVKWLEEVRPQSMQRGDHGGRIGGRKSWANDAELRALYRAEHEGGRMKLEVADRICVKLDLHIDSEMPAELWTDDPKRGKAGIRTNPQKVAQVIALIGKGLSPNRVGTELGMSPRTVRKIMAATPAFEGLRHHGEGTWKRAA
jgi:AraC-like DNA-binding protein